MALKSSREGLRKELVDYLGNLIINDNLRNEIIKAVGDNFITSENLNEAVNNLTMQITTESGERIEADTTLQNNINAESTAREQAISNLEELIGSGGLQIDLLWTNANPISEFAPQTINLDLSGYRYIAFNVAGDTTTYNSQQNLFLFSKTVDVTVRLYAFTSILCRRLITITNSGIVFQDGGFPNEYNAQFNSNSNSVAIPLQIYGVK